MGSNHHAGNPSNGISRGPPPGMMQRGRGHGGNDRHGGNRKYGGGRVHSDNGEGSSAGRGGYGKVGLAPSSSTANIN